MQKAFLYHDVIMNHWLILTDPCVAPGDSPGTPCDHVCIPLGASYRCSCWSGFHLNTDLRTCIGKATGVSYHWFRWWLGAEQATSHYRWPEFAPCAILMFVCLFSYWCRNSSSYGSLIIHCWIGSREVNIGSCNGLVLRGSVHLNGYLTQK